MSWGCLNVNSRCFEGVCTQLGLWSVSRGFEVSLKKVLTFCQRGPWHNHCSLMVESSGGTGAGNRQAGTRMLTGLSEFVNWVE